MIQIIICIKKFLKKYLVQVMIRIDRAGEEIKAEAPAKKPGFFDTPGAAYDPRSWNKQKFYESLAKKNPPSTME
jgi:hypothetical protein